MVTCDRCKGTGRVAFSRDGGVCYSCKGKGKVRPAKRPQGETCSHGALIRLGACFGCKRERETPPTI